MEWNPVVCKAEWGEVCKVEDSLVQNRWLGLSSNVYKRLSKRKPS
jgi:hypothetical protein